MTRARLLAATLLVFAAASPRPLWASSPFGPVDIVDAAQPISHLLLPPAGCTESAGNGWAAVDLPARPTWVDVCAERRLRLTPALPGIQAAIVQDVAGYFANRGPGLAVGISLDDGLFYSQGFGQRDPVTKATPDESTTFRAGSLSKLMTGTTLSTLIEDPAYHIALTDKADDPRYIPELAFVCAPPHWGNPTCVPGIMKGRITIANLVSHTSGLPSELTPNKAYTNELDFRADLKQATLLFPPGLFTAYSNTGADAVGLIIFHVTGMSLAETVRQRLFAPLGMTDSSMNPKYPAPGAAPAQMWRFEAHQSFVPGGYLSRFLTFTPWASIGDEDQPLIDAAGGLSTSIRDLSTFSTLWLTGRAPLRNGKPILSQATIQAATTALFQSTATPPSFCTDPKGTDDPPTGFHYRPCDRSNLFSVAWAVGQSPFIQHGGSIGVSGGQIVIDMDPHHPIAATALVSTDPAPVVSWAGGPKPDFLAAQAHDNLMTPALAADNATSWVGQALPTGVARVLWLSGAKPPPLSVLALVGSTAYRQALLTQFSFGYRVVHRLSTSNVQDHVDGLFAEVRDCSTFRVRKVIDGSTLSLRMLCASRAGGGRRSLDVTVRVDTLGHIDGLTGMGSSSGTY